MNGLKSSKCQNYISVTVRQTKGSKSSALLSGLADHGPDMGERNFTRRRVASKIEENTWQLGSRIFREDGEPVKGVGVVLREASSRHNA